MSFKSRSLRVSGLWQNKLRSGLYCDHIWFKLNAVSSFKTCLSCDNSSVPGSESDIEKNSSVIVNQYTGVKRINVILIFTQGSAVFPFYIAEILIFTGRGVTDSNRQNACIVKTVIEIISSVCAFRDIGSKKAVLRVFIVRILIFFVNRAFKTSLRQVINRRGPAYIIIHAEQRSVKSVVRAVNIKSVAENMRLGVGNIFP